MPHLKNFLGPNWAPEYYFRFRLHFVWRYGTAFKDFFEPILVVDRRIAITINIPIPVFKNL